MPLILIVGNIFTFIAFLFIKLLEFILNIVNCIVGNSISNIFSFIIKTILNVGMFLIIQIIQIILLINQRQNEYSADNFALNNGYGGDLLETLYILQKLDLGGKMTLLERLKNTHPDIENRIAKLEQKIELVETI